MNAAWSKLCPLQYIPSLGIRLHVLHQSEYMWQAEASHAAAALQAALPLQLARYSAAEPWWAFLWPGGFAVSTAMLKSTPARQALAGSTFIDIGTGCGVAAITAAAHTTCARIIGNDIDPLACAVARANVAANACSARYRTRVRINHSDVLALSSQDQVSWLQARSHTGCMSAIVLGLGDMLYDADIAPYALQLASTVVQAGGKALVGDPGRAGLPGLAAREAFGWVPLGSWPLQSPAVEAGAGYAEAGAWLLQR